MSAVAVLTRASRALGLCAVIAFFVAAFTPLPNFVGRWMSSTDESVPAEAIVVLAGGLQPDGTLTSSSVRRTLKGIALYERGLAPLLVFTGPRSASGAVEAQQRALLARKSGIPGDAIVTADAGRTTREEAVQVAELLATRGVRRILLVTDPVHMARARGAFERVHVEVRAAPTQGLMAASSRPGDRLSLASALLQEFIARLYYRALRYV